MEYSGNSSETTDSDSESSTSSDISQSTRSDITDITSRSDITDTTTRSDITDTTSSSDKTDTTSSSDKTDTTSSSDKSKTTTDSDISETKTETLSVLRMHNLPPVVLRPKSYYLRIPCAYQPYYNSFKSIKKLLAPSPDLTPRYPIIPSNVPVFPRKKIPPQPSVYLRYYSNSVVLSWNFFLKDAEYHLPIKKFAVYLYKIPAIKTSSCSWQKILNLDVEDLPYICRSVQLQGGNTYYFTVCAVDEYARGGPFSVPKGISLLPPFYKELSM